MPTFATPEPIDADLDLVVGDARITASDRTDTVVEVRPSNPDKDADVRAAEETRVEFSAASGRLTVRAPKQRGFGRPSKTGSIDLTLELPAGSRIDGAGAVATFNLAGRIGACRLRSSTGDIQIEESAALDVSTSVGEITVERVSGDADVRTGSGRVRIRHVTGTAVIKNSNGDSWVGEVTGDLRVNAANGDIVVDRAGGNVDAATANGDVRVGGVTRGSATLKTALGQIEIGVNEGTAARLDAHTSLGRVVNQMTTADQPAPTDETVDVRARTSYGDILIRRG
jgi:DUF4097 and DUF4098 domain-containing protein YvlB